MAFALITGASGGIGLAIAFELAERKKDLLLIARSSEKLNEAKSKLIAKYNIRVEYLSIDLSTETSADEVLTWIKQNNYPVDILINNAGYGVWGSIENTSWSDLSNMLHLNVITLTALCNLMIPELRKHSQAYILNIASTAAYQAVPTLSTYAATKAYVLLFTRGLRRELKSSNISVTCVCPGATSTQFVDRAGMNEALKKRSEKFSMSAVDVARISIKGMLRKKAEVLPGFTNWFSVQLTHLLPKFIPESIAESLYKTKS